MTRRRILVGLAMAASAAGLGWALMSGLARLLRDPGPSPVAEAPVEQPTPPPAPAVPRIKASLFFAAADGHSLVAVEHEIPFAEGRVAEARALIEAQLAARPPAMLAPTIPEGTTLRGLYVSERHEAFVDLDATVRDRHPGGSMNELLTVYTIVHAIASNLPDIQLVQVLIDGREVDTLAGHVDLRRPLRKNDQLVAP
jgi:hypothetical protein